MSKLNPTRLIGIVLVIATIAGLGIAAANRDVLNTMSLGLFAPSDAVGKTDPFASNPDYQPLGTLARGEPNTLAPTATVTTNGGSGLAGTYPDLASAITALNAATITGPVVISVSGTETAPVGGYQITQLGGTSSNTITIDGGGATVLTAFSPQTSGSKTDAIIKIIGGDYITIQGFSLQENAGNTTTAVATNNMTEFGIGLWLTSATNGAQNNLVQNNTISLSGAYQNAIGIFSSSSSSSTNGTLAATATTGTNSSNRFYGNSISNVAYGMYFICEPITTTINESGIDIGGSSAVTGNTITFGSATTSDIALTRFSATTAAGVYFRNGAGDTVRFNNVTSNALAYAQTSGVAGVFFSGTAPTGTTYTTTASNNPTISLSNTGATPAVGIDFAYGISTGTIAANSNGITINQNLAAASSGALTGIKANYTNAAISGNSNTVQITASESSGAMSGAITGITTAGSSSSTNSTSSNTVTINETTSATGTMSSATVGVTAAGSATTSITGSSNNVTLNITAGGGAVSGSQTGLSVAGTTATNTVLSNTILFNQTTSIASGISSSVSGIVATSAASNSATVGSSGNGNTITVKQAATGSGTYGSGAITYINANATHSTVNVKNNNLLTTGSSILSTGAVIGIFQDSTVTTLVDIQNNTMTVDRPAASGSIIFQSTSGTPSEVKDIVSNNNITFTSLAGTTSVTGISSLGGPSSPAVNNKSIVGNTVSISGTHSGTSIGITCSFTNTGFIQNNSVTINSAAPTVTGITTSGTTMTISGNTLNLNSSTTSPTSMQGVVESGTGAHSITNNTFAGMNFTGIITGSPTVSGFAISGNSGANLFANTVTNISVGAATSTATPTVDGILVSGGTSINVFKNKIYGITTAATGATTVVNGIRISGGSANTVYNNLIGNLTAGASTNTDSVRGIGITSTTTSSTNNLYFNSIYLTGGGGTNFGSSGIFHAASTTSTTAALNLRNNNIVNLTTPNGTGLAVAFRRSSGAASTLANYAGTSNNNNFYAGSPGASNLIYFDGTSSAQTMAAYKSGAFTAGTIAPRDNVSFSENPNFLNTSGSNANFLKINTTIATQLESGAVNISGITDDFEGDIRQGNAGYGGSGTAPDVGADEFNGILADLTGPAITYTLLGNGAAGASRAFSNVTITDATGVNGTAGTRPRVYYRKTCDPSVTFNDNTSATAGWKFAEASTGTSPFSFTIDYSLFGSFGTCSGAGVAVGDTVQYFVVAQDTVGTPNVSINAGTFAAQPSSVALTNAAFPIGGSVNSYNIVAAVAGTKTVCSSGCDYSGLTTATGVFNDINSKIITANVDIQITGDLTAETGAVALNATSEEPSGSNFTIKIYPTGGARVISGALASNALIRLNGADRVTIDGSLGGAGTDRSLTITNTATTAPSAISLISLGAGAGATNDTVKNCNISTGVATSVGYGISVGGATPGTSGADNDSTTIQNNAITLAPVGIYANGTAAVSSGGNDGLSILNNTTDYNGALTAVIGVQLGNATGATVSGNTVSVVTSGATAPVGYSLETGFVSSTVSGNKTTNVSSSNSGGWGGRGITVGSGSASSNLTIANNAIAGVNGTNWSSFGNASSMGIAVGTVGGSSTITTTAGGVNLYFNSVSMTGSMGSASTSALTTALYIGSGASALDIRDNALANTQVGTSTTQKNYAIFSAAANTAFTAINYNSYFVSNTFNGPSAILGNIAATDRTDLSGLQAGFGGNANSITSNPAFNSNSDLRPQLGSPLVGAGVAGTGVTTDLLGVSRNGTTPTIGAYENAVDSAPPVITYTTLGNTTDTSNRVLGVTITDASGVASGANGPRVYFKKNANPFTLAGSTACTGSAPSYSCTIDYSLIGGTPVAGDVISYFVTAQDVNGNVGANPSAGFAATDVNNVTSAPTTPNTYRIAFAVSGTLTVDGVGGGGNFASLTKAGGIFDFLNQNVVSGPTTINITADLTGETGAIALNEFQTGSVTIKPSGAAHSITGSTASTAGLIKLSGADNVTIDGSLSGGTDQSLTISNTGAGAIVWIATNASSGSNNVTVKNSILVGGGGISVGTQGILTGSGATLGNSAEFAQSNNTIQNNLIKSVQNAVFIAGNVASQDQNWNVTGNTFGSATTAEKLSFRGMLIKDAAAFTISQNTILGIVSSTTSSSTMSGIQVAGGIGGGSVTRNSIRDIKQTNTTGWGSNGIYLSASSPSSNLLVSNNFISDVASQGFAASSSTDNGYGIMIDSGAGYKILANTVVMNTNQVAAGSVTGAINIAAAANTVGGIDLRGNIFANTQTVGTRYGIIDGPAIPGIFSQINSNDYFAQNVGGTGGGSSSVPTAVPTLGAWQTFTGSDVNSVAVDPLVVSATDLHLQAGSALVNAGVDLRPTVANDFDGNPRPAGTAAEIGADELIDSTLPVVNLDLNAAGTPANPTTSTSATFTFSATDAVTNAPSVVAGFECSLDSPTFSGCSSPISYGPGLSVGSHTFKVHAIDTSGNVSNDAVFTWTILSPNQAPVASSFSVNVTTGNIATITMSATDAESNPLTFTITGSQAHGFIGTPSAPVCSGGTCTSSFTYAPDNGYTGPDQIRYKANDGTSDSNEAIISITVNSAACSAPPSGLISWHRGQGNALDTQGPNFENGTAVGGITYSAGRVGNAFNGDGGVGSYVSLDNPAAFNTQDFSVDAWVKRASAAVVSNNPAGPLQLGGIMAQDTNGWGFGMYPDGRLIFTKVGVDSVSSSAVKVTDTSYHHVAVTKVGSVVTFYVDGVAETAGAYNPGFSNNGGGTNIGRFASGGGEWLGQLDEVQFYGRVLTGAEIRAIYDTSFAGNCVSTFTVAYNGNTNTGGTAPTDGNSPYASGSIVTVLGNSGSLVKTGYAFNGWNTAADGSGTPYQPGNTFQIGVNTTLYAQWIPLPSVTSTNPSTGPAAGGQTVVISGSGFTGTTSVTFGGTNVAGFTVNNDNTITVTTPAHAGGPVSVVVTTPAGSNPPNTAYAYAAPVISNVIPSSGATTGNTVVTITGLNFTGASAVKFGGTAATGFTFNSDTQITATTPAHVAGAVSVDVTSGTVTNTPNTAYTFVGADYAVSTTGNQIIVTDQAGNTDTLTISEPGAGQIKFAAAGRTFSVNGGAFITGDSGNVPLASVTQIIVNAQAGDDTISVGAFTSSLPSLTLNGGTGNDAIQFNGNVTFASGASLDADMQNDDPNPGSDDFIQFVSGQLTLSGSGSATFKCTKFISMASGTKVQTANGNIIMEANQQAVPTLTGTIGINIDGATVQATGSGTVTIKGKGGNSVGISVTNGSLIQGGTTAGTTTTIVDGTGGSQATNMHGVQVGSNGLITSFGGDVSVTGHGGTAGNTNLGIILFPGAPNGGKISSTGNGAVTVNGTGGVGGGDDGIRIDGAGSGVSAGGSGVISVTGTAGASGPGISISRQGFVQSTTGPVTLTGTGTGGGNGIQMLNGNTNVTTGGNATINFIADTMDIAAAQSISANTGVVNIRQNTNGKPISLGGADGPTQLGLTDAELDRVTAGILNIGDSNTSNTQVDGVITQTKTTNLKSPVFTTVFSTGSLGIFGTLTSGLNVNNGGTVAPGASPGIINTGSDFNMGSGANLAIEIGGATPGNGSGFHDQVNVTGAVNLDGNLSVSNFGGFTPAFGQTYTIINNDGSDAVSGTFTGLPEGTSVPIGGTGRSAKISYVGGSGNDVVLTVDAIPGTMQFSSATYSVGEAGPSVTLTVTRTGGSDGPISATYALGGGTANGGSCGGGADYDNTGGSVSFANGDTANKSIVVPICDDAIYESNETFNATLTGTNLGSPSVATVTINDNDTAPTFAVNDVSVNEGDSGLTNLTFTITRTGATAFNSTVNFHTADGSATVADNDYQPILVGSAPSGVACSASCVTFLPGDLTKQVTVKVVGDTNIEPDENFHLLLDSVTNGTISDGDGLGTIINDDAVPVTQFSASTYVDDESQDIVFRITRTGNTSIASSVRFSTTGGGTAVGGASCTTGVDYVTITNQLVSFSTGQTSQNVPVTTCGDNTIEPGETFNAALSSPTTSILGSPSTAQATIRDTASRFTNHNFIDMTLGGNGSLYPSPIVVSGAPTVNGGMRVTLYDVSYLFPDNIDILLVDPAGRKYVLMGDAGGPTSIDPSGAVTLTFDDFAPQVLPDSDPLTTGKFKPTTWESPVTSFAAPAPAGPYNEPGGSLTRPPGATFASTFGGFNPNGTWNLYVRDDAGTPFTAPNTATGSIAGGWGIQFFAPTAAGVQVSGRVMNASGGGLRNARVVMTDQHGVVRTAITNAFGYYTFDDVLAGEAYLVGVDSRNYTFTTRVIQVFDTLTDVDFIPQ